MKKYVAILLFIISVSCCATDIGNQDLQLRGSITEQIDQPLLFENSIIDIQDDAHEDYLDLLTYEKNGKLFSQAMAGCGCALVFAATILIYVSSTMRSF